MRCLPFLLLAGCVQPLPPTNGDANALGQLAGAAIGPAQRCVSPGSGSGLTAVDSSTLVYRIGSKVWVNRVASDCPSLSSTSTIVMERFGSQICRGDIFRTVDHGLSIPSGACVLGDFVPHRAR